MQKATMIATTPLLCMVMTILPARIFNQEREAHAESSSVSEKLAALQAKNINNTQITHEIRTFLHHYKNTYNNGDMASLEPLTFPVSWKRWHTDALSREQILPYLKQLSTWKEFSVETPQQRPSGHVEVILRHNGECLKAWLFPSEDGWQFEGLVSPPRWHMDII